MHKNNTPEIVEYPQMIDSSSRKRQYINPEEPVTPVEPRNFISYPYMIAIMSVLQVLTALYNRHFITFFGYDISFGSLLLFPWVIFIFQISAECYGWQYARQIVWCNFIVNGITTVVTFTAKFIGYSSLIHATMKSAYITLVDTMWVACAMSWMVIFISDYITSALASWSRIKILLSSSFIILPFNGYSIENTVHTFYSIFLARAILSIMLLPIVRCIIWYIQHRVERVVVFDYKKDFSPLKVAVNLHDAIQFDTKEWSIMPNTLKKNFNFARAMMIYQSTHANCRFTVK